MKHIQSSLAILAVLSLSNLAVAGHYQWGGNVLVTQRPEPPATTVQEAAPAMPPAPGTAKVKPPAQPAKHANAVPTAHGAPALDASSEPAAIAPPIQPGTVRQAAPVVEHHHAPRYYRPVQKKQSVLDKLMELERKKNAWLRRTFLGR